VTVKMGLDTKADWLTDRQSQYDFDLIWKEAAIQSMEVEEWPLLKPLPGNYQYSHCGLEKTTCALVVC
jgi:hypothetical protein